MTLFRLDASFRAEGSHSRAIADIVEAEWREANPHGEIVRRDVGLHPLPSDAWASAVAAGFVPAEHRSQHQLDSLALAANLTDELVNADQYLFAAPLYNWGVSQHFKTWIDLVIADPRAGFGATEPLLAGRSGVLVTVRGGNYRPGTPRESWNHATGYMRRVLADFWGLKLEVVETEFTLVDVNPAFAEFKELAAQLRAEAEELAREYGRALA